MMGTLFLMMLAKDCPAHNPLALDGLGLWGFTIGAIFGWAGTMWAHFYQAFKGDDDGRG